MNIEEVIGSLSEVKVNTFVKTLRNGANRAGSYKIKLCTGLLPTTEFNKLSYEQKLKVECSDGCSGLFVGTINSKSDKCDFCQHTILVKERAKSTPKRRNTLQQ